MSDLTDKTLITEADVRGAIIGTTFRINETALVTPLAADLARERHIRLERMTAKSTAKLPLVPTIADMK